MTRKRFSLWLSIVVIVSLFLPYLPHVKTAKADSTEIAQYDFEDGTTQGWAKMGNPTVTASTVAAHAGSYSLLTTGRTQTYEGPSIDLTSKLQKGATYEITGYVKLVSGDPTSKLNFTMKRTPTDGTATQYDQVTSPIDVTDSGWVKLNGQYTFSTDVSGLTLYLESDNATDSYYLDDVTITMVSPPPSGDNQTIVSDDFENGNQSWGPQGSVTVTSSTDDAHSGTHSLLTTGRTATWNGPSLDLTGKLEKGATYEISGYVKIVSGDPTSKLNFTIKRTPTGGTAQYDQVTAPTDITDSGWVKLDGQYTFATDVSGLNIYLESDNATNSYYLDDFTITMISPPPTSGGSSQDNIKTGFEDQTKQNWGPRIGDENLSVTNADAKSGSYSLLTEGRQHPYDGPSLDITNNIHPLANYHFSVWVKLAPGESPTQLRMSIQHTKNGQNSYETVAGNTTVSADNWVQLSGDYTLPAAADSVSVYVESNEPSTNTNFVSYYIDDFSMTYVPPVQTPPVQQDIPSLKDVLGKYFDIGAAVVPADLNGKTAELLKKHYNSLVPGNAMKPASLEPSPGVFTWDQADQIVKFAQDNNMKLRFHTLVWHNQTPDWFFQDDNGNFLPKDDASKQLVLQRLHDYITTVLGRYGNDVDSIDVVNEVIDPAQPNGMRNSYWYQYTGTDYIKDAFTWAHAAAPNAKLYINDYNTYDPTKLNFLYNLVKKLLAEGVPVDGVGHQMHVNIDYPSIPAIADSLDKFASLGLDNKITELDVSCYNNSTDTSPVSEDTLIKQGYRYEDLFNLFRQKSNEISQVITWGVVDSNSWLKTFPITRDDQPLLFDKNYQAKYAYWGIVDPSKLPVIPKQAKSTKGTRKINGKDAQIWKTAGPQSIQTNDPLSKTPLSGSFRTFWDNNHLYVQANVTDPTHGENGQVDVFVDGNNGKTDSYQSDDKHYTFNTHGKTKGQNDVVVETKNGYRIVMALPLSTVKVGDKIGFDIRISDGKSSDTVSWSDVHNTQDKSTANWGVLTLDPPMKVAVAVQGTPKVDAIEDAIWKKAPSFTTNNWVQGTSGATATVKTMWDSKYLYVYADVIDSKLSKASTNPWEQDSVELFVDQNNGKTSTYQSDDGQYRVNFDNEQSYGGKASADNFITATRQTSTGYVVEAAIKLDSITPKKGSVIGFDAQVNNDQNGDGTRNSVATWSDPTGNSYQDTSVFGSLILEPVAPAVASAGLK